MFFIINSNLPNKKWKDGFEKTFFSKLACTCSLLFIQCLLQNQGKDRRIKENTLAQIEKDREKQRKEKVKLRNMAQKKNIE